MNKRKILLIDDQRDMVQLVQGLLTREGYEVITAYDGLEGLEKLKASEPHLIILDINMPKLDGAGFYERIYDPETGRARYPVLVLTARANLEELFTKLNVDGFMIKPYEIEDLLAHIQMILYRRYDKEKVAKPAVRKETDTKEKKILIIENDLTVFGSMVAAFAAHGFILRAAKTGVEGIEFAISSPPDLILANLRLPDISGDSVALKIQDMPRTSDIPIVLYVKEDIRREYAVLDGIRQKLKLGSIIESDKPEAIFGEAEKFLRTADDSKKAA